MKKLFSTLILTSLLLPSLVSALQPVYRSGEGRLNASTTAQGNIKDRKMEATTEFRKNASTTRPKMASSTKEMGFCAQIDKALVSISTKGLNPAEKRAENIVKRDEKLEDVRTQVDTRREENNVKRKGQLEELSKRATTEEQKKAVTNFTMVIDKALVDKKTATDAVIAAHRKNVDQVIATRRAAADKALTTLKTNIELAKTKAKSDCAANIGGDTVRKNLKDALQIAQETFRTTVSALQKDILPVKNGEKKAELRAIEEAYKKSVDQARKDLKAALKPMPKTSTETTYP